MTICNLNPYRYSRFYEVPELRALIELFQKLNNKQNETTKQRLKRQSRPLKKLNNKQNETTKQRLKRQTRPFDSEFLNLEGKRLKRQSRPLDSECSNLGGVLEGDSCFVLNKNKSNWEWHQDRCQSQYKNISNSRLAWIPSKKVWNSIRNFLFGASMNHSLPSGIWIGLKKVTNIPIRGDLHWMHENGSPGPEIDWGPDRGSEGSQGTGTGSGSGTGTGKVSFIDFGQNCLQIRTHSSEDWNDVECNETFLGLCEIFNSGFCEKNSSFFIANDRCFLLSKEKLNWNEQNKKCAEIFGNSSGRLAWIQNSETWKEIQANLFPNAESKNHDGIWIGLQKFLDPNPRNSIFWMKDRYFPGVRLAWGPDKEKDGGTVGYLDPQQDCLRIRPNFTNQWNDVECSDQLNWGLCEICK